MTGAPAGQPTSSALLYRYGARLRVLDLLTTVGMFGAIGPARRLAVEMLHLRPGQRALDLACGTGSNLPLMARAVGPTGEVMGVDDSPALLAAARRRMADAPNVRLVRAHWPTGDVQGDFDAGICCLGLTVMSPWKEALDAFLASVREGGRLAILDWLVHEEQGRLMNAYIRAGSRLASARPTRAVLAAASERLDEPRAIKLRAGLQLVAGTRRS